MLRRTVARYSRSVAAALIAVTALTTAAHLGPARSAEPGTSLYVQDLPADVPPATAGTA